MCVKILEPEKPHYDNIILKLKIFTFKDKDNLDYIHKLIVWDIWGEEGFLPLYLDTWHSILSNGVGKYIFFTKIKNGTLNQTKISFF